MKLPTTLQPNKPIHHPFQNNDLSPAIAINPQSGNAYKERGTNRFYMKDIKGACLDWGKTSELGNRDVFNISKHTVNDLVTRNLTP